MLKIGHFLWKRNARLRKEVEMKAQCGMDTLYTMCTHSLCIRAKRNFLVLISAKFAIFCDILRYSAIFDWERAIFSVVRLGAYNIEHCSAWELRYSTIFGREWAIFSDARLGMSDVERYSTGNERYSATFYWEWAIFSDIRLGKSDIQCRSAGNHSSPSLLGWGCIMFCVARLGISDVQRHSAADER